MRRYLFLVVLALLLSGCGDYWASQADVSRSRAQAQAHQSAALEAQARAQAEATIAQAKGEAERARLEGEAELTRAEASARMTEAQARVLATNSATPILFVVIAIIAILAVTAVAGLAIYLRSPAPIPSSQPTPSPWVTDPPGFRIATPEGVIYLVPDRRETRAAFLLRAQTTAELLGGGRLLPPSER